MKLESKILIWANTFFMLYTVYFFRDLLLMMILPLNNDIDLVLDKDINKNIPPEKLVIPKWIHQTYKTDEIPEHWVAAQKQCIDLHYPDYNYTLWTDAMVSVFLQEKYPSFLETFNSYEHNIQRADALRYFILREYGGIYIDLDDACERKLDPLLQYPAFFRKTSPLGISNDVMGTIPQHPLFIEFTENLEKFSKINILNIPYLSIMFSTGPMFVSIVYQRWIRKAWSFGLGLNKGQLDIVNKFRPKVMQPYQYKNSIGSFFKIAEGSSWHTDDSNIMFVLGAHITACVVGGFILFFVIFYAELLLYVLIQNVLSNLRAKNNNNNQNNSKLTEEFSSSNNQTSTQMVSRLVDNINDENDNNSKNFFSSVRLPFQLKINRFINKVKGTVTGSYSAVSNTDYLPTHNNEPNNLNDNFPLSSNQCNNKNRTNYQRHQMRRQSNLPLEIQQHLKNDKNNSNQELHNSN
ncbi:hypothetical protein ACO0SA_004273 [Hanseniaspora valbyensis]